MTLRDESFSEFIHPLLHTLMDKNRRFQEHYGLHEHWEWDVRSSAITFSDLVLPRLQILATVVGTTQGDSWEWSWANPKFKGAAALEMEKVREFGRVHGYRQLTSEFLEADEDTGWEMTAAAAHVLEAPGAYRFPTERGYCYLIYRKIEVVGPVGVSLHSHASVPGDPWGGAA